MCPFPQKEVTKEDGRARALVNNLEANYSEAIARREYRTRFSHGAL